MNASRIRAILLPAVVLVMVFAWLPGDALAGSSESCQSYAGSNACRKKGVVSTGSSTWSGQVWSTMKNPPIDADTIGYSYWTVRETCDGQITSQVQYGGYHDHNTDSFYDVNAMAKHACPGSRLGHSLGNHDFDESGYQHIYPYKSYSQGI